MDRSLKWRTLGLLGIVLLCVGVLTPNFVEDPKSQLPSWFPFKKKINLGLDLKGGLHIVYSIDLNTASDQDILTIPGLGQRMLREFKEYRPYKSMEQFRREIGKYVDKQEVARLERYVTIK